MASKAQVIDTHLDHPEWSSSRIARELDCTQEYVRATFRRNGLMLAGARSPAQRRADHCEAERLRKKAAEYLIRAERLEALARKGISE